MNITEMRKMDDKQLQEHLNKLQRNQIKLRIQRYNNQSTKKHLLKENKIEIARVHTLLKEFSER